jgi:hypothetical protein
MDATFSSAPSVKLIQLFENADVYSLYGQDLEMLCAPFHEVERAGWGMDCYFRLSGGAAGVLPALFDREQNAEPDKKYPICSTSLRSSTRPCIWVSRR